MPQVYTLILEDLDARVRCTTSSCVVLRCINKNTVFAPATKALIADPTTQRQACTALDALFKILQNVVYYYSAPPSECRTGLLDNALVKAAGTGASWLAAHATLDSFLPYFVPMVELRHFFVTSGEIKETEWMSLL